MLKHCVFVQFKSEYTSAQRLAALEAFKVVGEDVEGMLDFAHGPNRDFENKSPAYGEGFIITFRDRAAHLEYERHPTHVRLGQDLVAMCEGGYDGIMVYDLDCA